MAFKMSKIQIKALGELRDQARQAEMELEEAYGIYKVAVDEAREALNEPTDAYNEVLGRVATFLEEVADTAEEDLGEKSDAWVNGEKGQAVQAWIDALRELELVEVELPEEVEPPTLETSLGDDLDTLPESPEEVG